MPERVATGRAGAPAATSGLQHSSAIGSNSGAGCAGSASGQPLIWLPGQDPDGAGLLVPGSAFSLRVTVARCADGQRADCPLIEALYREAPNQAFQPPDSRRRKNLKAN